MSSTKATMLGEAFFAKAVTSMLFAIGMYWMRVPHSVEILLMMQGLDLVMGALVAWVKGEFQSRELFRGILLKSLAYPFLAACDLTEDPLRLSFHVDSYVALALISYEFLSIVETYSRVRPLPRFVAQSVKTLQEWLASTPDLQTKKVKTVTQRVEIETPPDQPNLPAVVTTVTEESHTEPVNPEKEKEK